MGRPAGNSAGRNAVHSGGAGSTRAYPALIRSLPGPERLRRALELTALVRDLAWAGAVRRAGHRGEAAVVHRFLRQFHGEEVARAWSSTPPRD